MTQTIVFLRALNVGGKHIVKMAELRQHFAAMGFADAATYIQSGNVILQTKTADTAVLEQQIEQHLQKILGYPVAAFARTTAEIQSILHNIPFPQSKLDAGAKLYIAFLKERPDDEALTKLTPYQNEIDSFQFGDKELYWLCQKTQSQSKFSGSVLEKTVGCQATLRGLTTIQKIAAKYLSVT
ncbi:MAG: DUF1697 domain-containing protein [Chloroflexi bacterium]|nr:DUF1697 domain-containing protein [Chloroflexota bacterium]